MSLHKLTAGAGYTYLTRQVAAHDRTGGARMPLASYYAEKGETPGQWVGRGMSGVEGLSAGDEVTAEQMKALYGEGLHPLAQRFATSLAGPDITDRDRTAVTRLGTPFATYPGDVTKFQVEVARRLEDLDAEAASPEVHARVRTEVALQLFRDEKGREPFDARELGSAIARYTRPRTTAVAGCDLTFSPVKSVSALWAVASPPVAAQIELAHHDAVRDALAFIEGHALFTREGKGGVRQVDVTGLVAAAFVHRDSRAGDPDLHTHVAVANKVQTLAGKWLSIDGRLLYKANVVASETYNTALEGHLSRRLGLRFTERPHEGRSLRPVRDVVGVDQRLIARWSSRRASIVTRTRELYAAFQADHGRPPTVVESIHLAQVATLQTRDAKHEPRSLDEQRATWIEQATDVLGGQRHLAAMLHRALSPTVDPVTASVGDDVWVTSAARLVLAALQQHRSIWQVWHVRSEAHRQVRSLGAAPDDVDALVDRVTSHVLNNSSVRLTRAEDGVSEPPTLRRRDGASVYTVAGSAVYTSSDIIAAEQQVVSAAGVTDRPAASEDAVTLALLEQAANGVTLNTAQVALVRSMATSGRRVQLALAPAGSGKTTAMTALANAWTGSGGTLIGFAPSAAAAAVLRDHIGTTTDTLAKLTWSITHGDLPDWANHVGPHTMAIIDEAGLADTLTLATAVDFITGRGGQVRLVGDHHQLSAIGAGGVLHDIATTHGAIHLTELVRFLDPAEGSASLALREGRPEALGFYLDHRRVHVGGLTTITDDAFTAWATDRTKGLNSIMIAPTRELVSELNRRAQSHHHRKATPSQGAPLHDGSAAHRGDTIITRRNHRHLTVGARDWVKNGDRWNVVDIHPDHSLTVQCVASSRSVRLPAEYVAEFVELGYATTIHGAQGLSVDTMHGLATGSESRQQLYTMLTRGAVANHVYVQTAGDGDPHSVIRPENAHPPTATDILEGILARDDRPVSATTLRRENDDPAARLGEAAARYTDALHHAAELRAGAAALALLDADAEHALPGLTDEPAWPTLRSHLTLLATTGIDPTATLRAAIAVRETDSAHDRAAALDWRLDDTALAHGAPLPWLPGIPPLLAKDPAWGPYLKQRAQLTSDLAKSVAIAAESAATQPDWVLSGQHISRGVATDIAVWRAAHAIDACDLRPTGPPLHSKAEALWQRALTARLGTGNGPAVAEWTLRLNKNLPATIGDPYTPRLAAQLCDVARVGIDVHALLRTTTAAPLPDDHPAAALWWRISRHLTPAATSNLDHTTDLTPPWARDLADTVGPDKAVAIQSSRWWPALVTASDHALAQGISLTDILTLADAPDSPADVDQCQALVWRLTLLTDSPPPDDEPTLDPTEGSSIPPDEDVLPTPDASAPGPEPGAELAALQLARSAMGILKRSDVEIEHEVARAAAWDDAPFTPERAAHINAMARDYYTAHLHDSWAGAYLCDRLRTTTPPADAGYAPPGWTNLTNHLRHLGVTDDELLAVGISSRARTGRLIDRFRDRLILPIVTDGQVLGFAGRRHPDADDGSGPKYLNTPTTALFHKGDVLYGYDQARIHAGATPVLVEGPLDALAINQADGNKYLGVAPLGTALTQTQARLLADVSVPIVATDNDNAGRAAAERAYWLLAQHATTPRTIRMPEAADPSDLLTTSGPNELAQLLSQAHPLAADLLHHAVGQGNRAIDHVAAVVAASPSDTWERLISETARDLDVAPAAIAAPLVAAARRWIRDPAGMAQHAIQGITPTRREGPLAELPTPRTRSRLSQGTPTHIR